MLRGERFSPGTAPNSAVGGHSAPAGSKIQLFTMVLKGILRELTPKGGVIVGGGVIVLRGGVVPDLSKTM